MLDDGRLTDAQSRTANFRNTVLIMTLNTGSQYLLDGVTAEAEIKPEVRELVMSELRSHFLRARLAERLKDDELVVTHDDPQPATSTAA